jgi:RNA polymerase sigma factor (sigma-70 family)
MSDVDKLDTVESLVDRAARGEVGAFEELYSENVGRVYLLCLRMCGDPSLAEELAQEAFVRAWQKLGSFRGASAFSTWLHRVTVNVVLGDRRSTMRREARVKPAGDDLPVDLTASAPFPARRRGLPSQGDRAPHRSCGGHLEGSAAPRAEVAAKGIDNMNCHESTGRFDDYLDGQLDADDANGLRTHLADCPSCADEFETIRELREGAAALPRSLEPPHDLWPGVEARISGARVVRGRFGSRALLAAAAAVLVITSVVTAYYIGRSSEVLLASFEGLGVNNYMARRTELLNALDARSHELSGETMDVVMENLLLIDQAMDRIAVALGEDPENEFLMKQLVGAYRQQINLLQRAVRLPAEV